MKLSDRNHNNYRAFYKTVCEYKSLPLLTGRTKLINKMPFLITKFAANIQNSEEEFIFN
jgi:hypothetical protein